MKQLWATIGDRKVAKPTIISALNLFRACTLDEFRPMQHLVALTIPYFCNRYLHSKPGVLRYP
jgi:hypothetical protein